MEIRIGTSGYSFDDWKGTFYPSDVAKGKMLDYYQTQFSTVEVNSTYYRIPHPAVLANMAVKTGPQFEFIIKANQSLTHQRQAIEEPTRKFINAIAPIAERGQLKGILAQFPWSWKYSPANLRYLVNCRELLAPYPLFVEFRHDSWLRPETTDLMRQHEIGFVSVDGPRLQGLMPPEFIATGDTAYIRLHGRNADHWWSGGALRYDYNYSRDELQEWKDKLAQYRGDVKKSFIFFNNCHLGQAVKNARDLMQLLDI
jgi:uncharacterized protein YecE (DUF72 family)